MIRLLYNSAGNLPVFAHRGGAIEKLVGEQIILLKDKADVSLFGTSDLPIPGIIVHHNPTRFKSMSDMWLRTFTVLRQLLQVDTDIVISIHGLTVFSSFIYAKLRRKRYVAWEYDHVMWIPPFTIPRQFYHQLVRSADLIITESETQRRRMTNRGVPANKISVIPLGVDLESFSPCVTGKRENTIVCVAKFAKHKNQLSILKAFKANLDRGYLQNYRLLFVGPKRSAFGPGGDAGYFLECSSYVQESHLDPYVTFTGFVQPDVLKEILRTSKLFMFMSAEEAFGLAVAQAMACGLPCIVNNIEPLPEVVGDAGIIVSSEDIEQVAEQMIRLVSDPILWQRYSFNARTRAEKCFDARVVAEQCLDLYRGLILS